MSEGVIVALITAGASLLSVVITNFISKTKVVTDIKLEMVKNQAVTDTKITELTREVREHNDFAKRMPVVENEIKNIKQRIEDLHSK